MKRSLPVSTSSVRTCGIVSREKAAQWVQVREKYSIAVTFASELPSVRSSMRGSAAQASGGPTLEAATTDSTVRRVRRIVDLYMWFLALAGGWSAGSRGAFGLV